MTLEGAIELMRARDWSVAVHNDYRQNGERRTFWLWTHPSGRWVKGEAATDLEAVNQCIDAAVVENSTAASFSDAMASAPWPTDQPGTVLATGKHGTVVADPRLPREITAQIHNLKDAVGVYGIKSMEARTAEFNLEVAIWRVIQKAEKPDG